MWGSKSLRDRLGHWQQSTQIHTHMCDDTSVRTIVRHCKGNTKRNPDRKIQNFLRPQSQGFSEYKADVAVYLEPPAEIKWKGENLWGKSAVPMWLFFGRFYQMSCPVEAVSGRRDMWKIHFLRAAVWALMSRLPSPRLPHQLFWQDTEVFLSQSEVKSL